MAGVDTIRGIAFQLAQTLSDVVDLVLDGEADAVLIEGEEDLVDYQVLDRSGRRLAVRQAKTRQGSGGWGATELARILCTWGELNETDDAEFAFVTDASLNGSGQKLHELIKAMREQPDATVLRQTASQLGRSGVQLPSLDVLQRVQILTRMGTTDQVLAQVEMRILSVLARSRLATLDDARDAVNRLFRRLFVIGGNADLKQRVITRADVLAALGVDDASLAGGLAWSNAVAESYRAAVIEASQRFHGFMPLDVKSIASMPQVLRLLDQPGRRNGDVQSPDVILDERQAVLIGATGQGKTTTLQHLAAAAAKRGLVPVVLSAAGHTPGGLHRRVRHAVEARLGQPLTAGALDTVVAAPDLVLLIDGVSEVDEGTREALHEDLQRLAAQRPLGVVATGRDLPLTIAVASLPDPPAAYRLTTLDSAARRELASTHGGFDEGVVGLIEQRLGDTADNPMLFLMALSVSADGVPDSRAEVYQQFLRGLAARAHLSDSEVHFAVLGSVWARLIGRGLRTADHYTWLSSLSAALDDVQRLPMWRGQQCTPVDALSYAQALGLLTRLDHDSGLAPLHDSLADYLAARAISRGEAAMPDVLSTNYDETVLFTVEMDGLSDELAYRLATENPLLACRIGRLPFARGTADPHVVGKLLKTFTADCVLPLLGQPPGLRICHHPRLTGVALAGDGYEIVDDTTFDNLTREHAALIVPPDTSSLQLAITLWAAAVRKAHLPRIRTFQPSPPADPELATQLLPDYLRTLETELHRLIDATLPATIRDQVATTVGPRGMVAYIDDPEPGPFGGLDLPVHYRPDTQNLVQRTGGRRLEGDAWLATTTLAHLMRRHPTHQAAHEIGKALTELTDHTWPEP